MEQRPQPVMAGQTHLYTCDTCQAEVKEDELSVHFESPKCENIFHCSECWILYHFSSLDPFNLDIVRTHVCLDEEGKPLSTERSVFPGENEDKILQDSGTGPARTKRPGGNNDIESVGTLQGPQFGDSGAVLFNYPPKRQRMTQNDSSSDYNATPMYSPSINLEEELPSWPRRVIRASTRFDERGRLLTSRHRSFSNELNFKIEADDQSQDENSEAESANEPVDAISLPKSTDLKGFVDNIRQLNPRIDISWGLDHRIASNQVLNYRRLVNARVKHEICLADGNCQSGNYCRPHGGSMELSGKRLEPNSALKNIALPQDIATDESEDEGLVVPELFPPGIPMPPCIRLPAEFECPLCFRVKKIQKASDWTKHVHEDVQPFTCTFSNCRDPKPFKRKADWVRHENERHRHLEWWTCDFEDCTHKCYRKDNFLQHLVREHKLPEPKYRTKAAVKKVALSSADDQVWAMVRNCHHDTSSRPQDEPCKFCGKILTSWKKLTVHLAKHMEQIVLPMLALLDRQTITADTIVEPITVEQLGPQTSHMIPPPLTYNRLSSFDNPAGLYGSREYWSGRAQFPSLYSTADNTDGFYRPPLPLSQYQQYNQITSYFPTTNTNIAHANPQGFGWGDSLSDLNLAGSPRHYMEGGTIGRAEPDWDIRSIASIGDSGIGTSLSLTGTPLKQRWDVASVATVDDSGLGTITGSTKSAASVQAGIPRNAQQEILLMLTSDTVLQALFSEGVKRINKGRFVRNVRRLLYWFCKDLQQIAGNPREQDAASMVGMHAGWFASRLFDISNPESNLNSENMKAHLNQQIDKRPILEKYLGSNIVRSKLVNTFQGPEILNKEAEIDEESSGESDSHESGSISTFDELEKKGMNIDYSEFPNLDHIKMFIVEGLPFAALRQHTFQFVYPEAATQVHLSNRKSPPPSATVLTTTLHSITKTISPSPGDLMTANESRPRSPDNSENPALQSSAHASDSTDMTEPKVSGEEEYGSDGDSDILSDDPDLYDAQFEARISEPKAHFERLARLEGKVFETSCLVAYRNEASSSADRDVTLLIPTTVSANEALLCEILVETTKRTMASELLQLLECSNIMARSSQSLKMLQEEGYCASRISMLVMDNTRSGVAKLVSFEVERVHNLAATFNFLRNSVAARVGRLEAIDVNEEMIQSIIEGADTLDGVATQCFTMLIAMGFSPLLLPSDRPSDLWRYVAQTLEFAVLSYAGAHIQRFDMDLLGTGSPNFQIPRSFRYHDPKLDNITRSQANGIQLSLRQLECLDDFLGNRPVWVFRQNLNANQSERLYLSTSIDALADIWGPSWKTVSKLNSSKIQKYDIGNGLIVPWSVSTHTGSLIPVRHSEVFCHWIPRRLWNDEEIDNHQADLPRNHFVDSDILLVGAPTEHGLTVNQKCTLTLERLSRIKSKLSEDEALRPLKVYKSKRYVDSHEVQLQASAMGFASAAGTVVYKRQKGHTMKDALVERWRHNLRNPMDLESFSGIEVSLCTKNARRRRLLHVLRSQTVCNYLRGISFDWKSSACELAYFRALRCPKAFRAFWKNHPEWRENVGDAISICMDVLEETGINEDNQELNALLVECFDAEGDSDGESDGESKSGASVHSIGKPAEALSNYVPVEEWIVTLFRSEHTWTGFLKDSEETLTMAIVGATCLDFEDDEGIGRRCSKPRRQWEANFWYKGFPVLQTSLLLNEAILKSEYLTHRKIDRGRGGNRITWVADELKPETTFSLGGQGTLHVLCASTPNCPVIMEWNPPKSERLDEVIDVTINQKLLGKNVLRHHKEYIRGKWEADPLPVLVLSKSAKPVFAKS